MIPRDARNVLRSEGHQPRPRQYSGHRAELLVLLAICLADIGGAEHPRPGSRAPACPVFPADNPWNQRGRQAARRSRLGARSCASIGLDAHVHADFGSGLWDGGPIGIPFTSSRPRAAPKVRVTFDYADESDRGPYPIPPNVPIEGGPQRDGDRHVLVVDRDACRLYELYALHRTAAAAGPPARARSGTCARTRLRPAGWTSADAAGLPILPGLVRYDEVDARARSTTRCAFTVAAHAPRLRLPGAPLRERLDATRRCRRWASACA